MPRLPAQVRLGLIVWEAALDRPLATYAAEYSQRLRNAVPRERRPLPMVAVCNKTDAMPCALPQIAGLPESLPFIAISAERAINTRLLWEEMVLPALHDVAALSAPVPAPPPTPAAASLAADVSEEPEVRGRARIVARTWARGVFVFTPAAPTVRVARRRVRYWAPE